MHVCAGRGIIFGLFSSSMRDENFRGQIPRVQLDVFVHVTKTRERTQTDAPSGCLLFCVLHVSCARWAGVVGVAAVESGNLSRPGEG